ncbi:hypothetical protein [Paenibacillus sp. LjRoot56]|uniref:hypothetical protein n=1 Tax=Paenibacillus sp. LjRoot56 TaxID=3342333 RepID=UPI003ECD7170
MKKYHSITLFFDYYIRVLNGGGSFTLNELYDLYITQESKVQLKLDLDSILDEFAGEDWETNAEVEYLYNNFGKNRVKK